MVHVQSKQSDHHKEFSYVGVCMCVTNGLCKNFSQEVYSYIHVRSYNNE